MTGLDRMDAIAGEWRCDEGVEAHNEQGALVISNTGRQRSSWHLSRQWRGAKGRHLRLTFRGELLRGDGVSIVAQVDGIDHYPTPLNSESSIVVGEASTLRFRVVVNANSSVRISVLSIEVREDSPDIVDDAFREGGILLVTPTYPSSYHLYLAGFVHSRVRAYLGQGVQPKVFVVHGSYGHQTLYDFEGVRVARGNYRDLQRVLSGVRFSKILMHFFDQQYGNALDSALMNRDTELLLWCHGPETLFRDLPAVAGPYFSRPTPADQATLQRYAVLESYVHRFAQRDHVEWVFVSEWQRQRSEELLGLEFARSHVIPNIIDTDTFAYREKAPKLRKKVFVLRRYDNERKYAVDLAVLAVIELSRRPCFKDLDIEFHGDGFFYDELLGPLRQFKNVKLRRHFLDHKAIAALHAESGIALFPTRYDAQGVSACEAASSGVVVVSSECTAIPEFLPSACGTLARTEDPKEYADIIERLVQAPAQFQAASRQMAEHVRVKCGAAATIERELALIKAPCRPAKRVEPAAEKLLTVLVPLYNMEKHLGRCVESLLGSNAAKLDVLIVDDGSTDGSLQVAKGLEARYPGIVRVMTKSNGGHGSVLNVGMAEARGRYFRVVDSDDWVDTQAFDELLARMEGEDADVVLTDYSEDWIEQDLLFRKEIYSNVAPGVLYDFETLTEPAWGFRGWGPILATANFKTSALRTAGFRLDEGISYVDMEYDALALTNVETVRYWDLDVYRYCLGRSGQTVSRETYQRKYKQHERVIVRICDFLSTTDLKPGKRRYLIHNLLKPLVEAHYLILNHWICEEDEFRAFDQRVRGYPFLRDLKLEKHLQQSIPGEGMASRLLRAALPFHYVAGMEESTRRSTTRTMKYTVKYLVPYAMVQYLKRERSSLLDRLPASMRGAVKRLKGQLG